jgi:hypothetical protein
VVLHVGDRRGEVGSLLLTEAAKRGLVQPDGGRAVQALSVGESVCPRRCDRSSYALDANGGERGVEACDELGVAIADEESEASPGVFEIGSEVTGHLGDPGTVGVGGDAEQVHPSSVDLDHAEHVETP